MTHRQLPVCTDARLFLPDGLPGLPDYVADDLREWLTHHGLDEKRIPMSSSILRTGDGKWLVWEEWNESPRALQLPAGTIPLEAKGLWTKLQAQIHPLPFPDSVREHVEDVRAQARATDARRAADRAMAEADAALAALSQRGGA